MQTDPNNTYGADSSTNVQASGSSNAFTLNQATNAMASTLDLDWTINGSNNSITASIDQDLATNYMDITALIIQLHLMEMAIKVHIFI